MTKKGVKQDRIIEIQENLIHNAVNEELELRACIREERAKEKSAKFVRGFGKGMSMAWIFMLSMMAFVGFTVGITAFVLVARQMGVTNFSGFAFIVRFTMGGLVLCFAGSIIYFLCIILHNLAFKKRGDCC